ncbi:hypothetical protein B5M09_010958, partial [Aphanomyces astaci]
AWGHPEFGQIVASCSFDRTVIVWEESLSKPPSAAPLPPHGSMSLSHHPSDSGPSQSQPWTLQAQLTDSRESVHDVKFAPRHLGLRLVTLWGFTVEKQWHVIAELAGHSDVIHDVAWAPNLGRSCHWLATASKDRTIRIWKLKINPNRQEQSEVVQVTTKDHGAFEVWRVQWNVTGTMLASTGDDGTVRMWQQDYKHQWQCVHAVSGDLA